MSTNKGVNMGSGLYSRVDHSLPTFTPKESQNSPPNSRNPFPLLKPKGFLDQSFNGLDFALKGKSSPFRPLTKSSPYLAHFWTFEPKKNQNLAHCGGKSSPLNLAH